MVQGELAWQHANTVRLSRAAGLWARLISLPRGCMAGHLARHNPWHGFHPLQTNVGLQVCCIPGHAGQILLGSFRANYPHCLQQSSESLNPHMYGNLCHACILLYMVTTLMLIMFDVEHLPGVGTMFLPMGVPLVIATPASARGVVSVVWAGIRWSMPLLQCPAHTLARNRWHQRSRCGRCLSLHTFFGAELYRRCREQVAGHLE